MDLKELGSSVQMPWEADGRRWHTRDRVGRKGEPCRWDGRILDEVVNRIHQLGEFGETNWNARSVVEIAAPKKTNGWFLHAITGETWLLKMKFRVARGTFQGPELQARLGLCTLNELDEVPLYGNVPRVRTTNARGPWQEVQINAFQWDEINSPAFWDFLEQSVAAFQKATEHVAQNPDDIMPWKKLGRKWHLMRKGFTPGRRVEWPAELLEAVFQLLEQVAPAAHFIWTNQVLVHVCPAGTTQPWLTVQTKKAEGVHLFVCGEKNSLTLGRIAHLGFDRDVDSSQSRDVARISLRTLDQLRDPDLTEFLRQSAAAAKI
jgi:excinuclease ABC subunit A